MKQISRKITHWQQNLPHHLESTLFDRNLLRRGDAYDKPLFWVLLCLLCFGLVMVYSASGVQAGLYHFDNRASFLIKQTQFALIGGAACYLLIRVPLWRWQRWDKYLFYIALISLFAVLFVGEQVNGARRWLPTPFGFKVQASEIFKLVTIIYMANFFRRKIDILHDFKRVIMVGIPVTLGAMLIYFTRDLGSAVVVFSIFLALLFLANMPKSWFFSAIGIAVLVGVVAIWGNEYRLRRVEVMWQPWNDPTGTGYQGLGSLLSLQRGGLFGEGLGNAVIKRGFLPEAHTDFILAVIGEELGLVTVGVWIAVQTFINVGVNISLLPNKGLTLPLISYGGSSLVIMMIALMLLLRVDYENRRVLLGHSVTDPKQPAPRTQPQPQTDTAESEDISDKA